MWKVKAENRQTLACCSVLLLLLLRVDGMGERQQQLGGKARTLLSQNSGA